MQNLPAGAAPPRAAPPQLPRDPMDALADGDPRALQRLIDLYWAPLLRYAERMIGSADAAEDVVQRGFIRLWDGRHRWEAGSSPRRLLYTVVRHLALNELDSDRARSRRNRSPTLPPRTVATPAQLLDERELTHALEVALDALPPRRREALVLARFGDLSHAEIAEIMGVAPRTVTNHITLALAELELALAAYVGD